MNGTGSVLLAQGHNNIVRRTLIEETAEIKIIRPHSYQMILALAKQREIIASTGQGAGKTSFMPVLLAMKMAQYATPGEYLFVEPTYGMIERVAIPVWEKAVRDTYFEGRWASKKDKIYENRFGRLYFLSAEKPKHIQGIHARLAVIDEGGQISREAYRMIKGRTNFEDGQTITLTNPYRNKDPYIYTDLLNRYLDGDPDILFLFFGSLENPSFDRKRYEADKKIMSKEELEFQYGGKYSKPKGLIYEYDDRDVVRSVKYNGEPCYFGVDFGMGDPTVVEVAFVNSTGVHIIHEYVNKNKEYAFYAPIFAELQKKYHGRYWFPDFEGVGKPAIAAIDRELRRLKLPKIPWKHAEKDVVEGVQAVKKKYRTKKLTISPACRLLLEENAGWTWGHNGKPKDENDHAETAVRLLITGLDRYVTPKKTVPEIKQKILNPVDRAVMEVIKKMNEKKSSKTNWLRLP